MVIKMYEELISDLRYCADKGESCGLCKHYKDGLLCLDNMLIQAADAIHQLSWHAHDWEKIADHWRKKYEELERQMREET